MSAGSISARSKADSSWTYRPAQAGHWDEALDASGHLRTHWLRLAAGLRRMGYPEFRRREEAGQRLIQNNGITYNVYADPQGNERPWLMDLVPLVIASDEWAHIERAVRQRATLLNTILSDLYGEQRLLRDRQLPPELVLANPAFLRPCRGIRPPSGVFLQNYAVDLARAPNGAWWVITDRAQAPSGLGYALENRVVSARTLPSLLDDCRVRPLGRFFDKTFETLLNLAPAPVSEPRVVVLTSGPHNETYFEHAYLSRHWGVPLVGGDDLTVRDSRVYLKTLAGLNPVDVIVRRMDDDFCDPLELRGESLLGVPGLVQAARAGNVYVANALGSGLVETPAMMAFLPTLCQHLLGEPLMLPSVATWWCGQDGPRRHVLGDLERLVIKRTFGLAGRRAEFPASMSPEDRQELARRIEARPDHFVAQEQVDLSTTPVLTHRGLEPRHAMVRVLAAWDGAAYSVMPGGLTRVATGRQSLVVSMQLGGGSKDTWVVGRTEISPSEKRLAPRPASADSSTELSSRMADNLFWLGRHTERLDSMARLIRALLPGLSGDSGARRAAELQTIVHLLDGLELLPREFRHSPLGQQWWRLQDLLGRMVFDFDRPEGIGWNVRQIRRLSREVKERLSQDTWRVLQQLEHGFSSAPNANPERRFVAAAAQLDDVVIMIAAFAGLLSENPTRGHGWRFLEIGRRVERALQMTDLLRVGVAAAPFPDDAYLEVLLQVADSSTTYRSRYLTSIRTRFVLELLLADETYPRSVAYQLHALVDQINGLPRQIDDGLDAHSLVARIAAFARSGQVETLKRRDARGHRGALEKHLHALRVGVIDLADALNAEYLSHSAASRLASTR